MRSLHLMIKPASGLCNMRCHYCFYADETSKRETASYGLMSRDTLSAVLEHALAAVTQECTIAFQGGEPTLAGLDFFRYAVAESLPGGGISGRDQGGPRPEPGGCGRAGDLWPGDPCH